MRDRARQLFAGVRGRTDLSGSDVRSYRRGRRLSAGAGGGAAEIVGVGLQGLRGGMQDFDRLRYLRLEPPKQIAGAIGAAACAREVVLLRRGELFELGERVFRRA